MKLNATYPLALLIATGVLSVTSPSLRASETDDCIVKASIVSLRGAATSMAQKELTTEYAKDVEGVKDVKNEMTVAKTSVKPAKTVGEKLDDASITAQVKMTLLYHRSTSAIHTSITTKNGLVTLTGEASNAGKRIWPPNLSTT